MTLWRRDRTLDITLPPPARTKLPGVSSDAASYQGRFDYSADRYGARLDSSISLNRVDLPAGQFTSRLYRTRADYGFTPQMFVSGLLQYSSSDQSVSSNLRFRWEYRPGSEFFAAYADERATAASATAALRNRSFALKGTRLLRF